MRRIADRHVFGVAVDAETRCTHYDAEYDVLSLRFGCCERFYPCFECHDAVADHAREPWPRDRFEEVAALCGRCGAGLTASEYLDSPDACPACGGAFNPGCAAHHQLYFAGE
ncbi:CHY zinc finger protein [Haloarchaeobius baliensis]|uniref:CHY zinc finger protein n=1 Tax=Haloarchaeobius baliensis TaxID=1670458 RepID=UPI003F8850EA